MKKKHIKTIHLYHVAAMLVIPIVSMFVSCDKNMEGKEYKVYDEVMIDEMMQELQLTSFLAIVDKANYRGTVHAYGTYTFFVPTNQAVDAYLKSEGKAGIDDLTEAEAVAIIQYHLVRDTISISNFVDGRLRTANFMKRYLTTKMQSDGSFNVNRQAMVITKNINEKNELKGANGYLHIVDAVLTPPENSITGFIRSLPDDDFSIMKRFFEKSGLADALNQAPDDVWITFFLQNNEAFQEANIESEADLLAQLRDNQKSSTMNDDELIRNYIGYHAAIDSFMPKYAVDLLLTSTLQTMGYAEKNGDIANKPILFERDGNQVYLNRLVSGEINDPGVKLNREHEYTDYSCSNGVVHLILGDMQIKERSAYRVYWDVATQPEIMALTTYRKVGTTKTFNSGDLSEMTWGGTYLATVNYICGNLPTSEATLDEKAQYVYGDYLRFNIHPNTIKWVEFKLPVLMPGEYKVWVCYRREVNLQVKTIFKQEGREEQIMPYVFNMNEYMATGTPEAMELLGWKQYTAKRINNVMCSHILGTIKVEYEGRHTLRIEPIFSDRQGQAGNWDMIHFIPKDEDQTSLRVDMMGNWVDKDTPNWQIYPYGTAPITE